MLNPEEVPLASEAVREFRVALSNLFLYSEANAMVASSLERFVRSLGSLFETRETLTLGVSDGRLVVEGSELDEKSTGSTNMILDLFKTHELHSLAFAKAVCAEDIIHFANLLRPKALLPGQKLVQVLQEQPVPNILANHRVFVAVDEGSAAGLASVHESEDGEFNAAMEALQYFLQVFGRVRPDERKQEMGRLVGEQMGEWLSLPGGGGVPGMLSGGASGGNAPWARLLAAVEGFKRLLESVPKPGGSEVVLQDLEQAMTRLMNAAAQTVEGGAGGGEGVPEEDQEALFETDPVLTALERKDLAIFLDVRKESKVAEVLQRLQEEPRPEWMETLWLGLWSAVERPEAEIQALGLRQVNRWKWQNLPRPFQQDGLTRLGGYLTRCQDPGAFQLALLLTYGWMSEEWKSPDWPIFNNLLRALSNLEHIDTEAFPEQRNKARLTFQGLFFNETLEELLRRSLGPEARATGVLDAWFAMGPRGTSFLLDKLIPGKSEQGIVDGVYGVLEHLEFSGKDVLFDYLGAHPKLPRTDVFLRLFERIVMTRGVAEKLRQMWDTFNAPDRGLLLEVAARWGRKEFRDVAFERIRSNDPEIALTTLRCFHAFALPGDSRDLIQVGESRNYGSKVEREAFTIELCDVLGRLAESVSVPTLQDWVQSKGFLDKLKEKSVAVKTAALKALGRYRSQQVRTFLEKYAEHGEKDLRPVAIAILAESETPPQK